MPRIRTVKPDYPKHRKVRAVSRDARLLNLHLLCIADDEGRLQELPNWIIGECFPTDDDVTTVVLREWLRDLEVAGLIARYEVDGERYIEIHDFRDHQVINKPRPSEIPAPSAGFGDLPDHDSSPTVAVPDDYLPEVEVEVEREGETEEERETSRRQPPTRLATNPKYVALCEHLADLIAANGSKRPTVTDKWTTAARRMVELDGHTVDEVDAAIRWSQDHEFWRGVILSMPKLREKFDQMRLQSGRGKAAGNAEVRDMLTRIAEGRS